METDGDTCIFLWLCSVYTVAGSGTPGNLTGSGVGAQFWVLSDLFVDRAAGEPCLQILHSLVCSHELRAPFTPSPDMPWQPAYMCAHA